MLMNSLTFSKGLDGVAPEILATMRSVLKDYQDIQILKQLIYNIDNLILKQ